MNTLSWNGRTRLMNYTRELCEIWLSGCTRILRFTRVQHMIQTYFRSSELLQVVCYIHYLVALTRVTWYVIPCQHHTEIVMDIKKKNRSNDFISIPHRSYVSLNGYTWSFCVYENVLLCLFSPYSMFFIIDNQQGIIFTFLPILTTTLPCTSSPGT